MGRRMQGRVEGWGYGVLDSGCRIYNGFRIEEVCLVDATRGGQSSVAERKLSSFTKLHGRVVTKITTLVYHTSTGTALLQRKLLHNY